MKSKEINMEKNIKPYKQRGMTCAIACMLMILEYYGKIPNANWLYEKEYYSRYKSKFIEGTPFSALAWHFAKTGLYSELVHSKNDMFDNKEDLLTEYEYSNSMREYKTYVEAARSKGAIIKTGVQMDSNFLINVLKNDKMVILAGQIDNILHAVLLCGYQGDNFVVCDPLVKHKQIKSKNEIESFMNTSLGKWCVIVGEKKLKKEI